MGNRKKKRSKGTGTNNPGRYDAALLGYDQSAVGRVSAYCGTVLSNDRGKMLMSRGRYEGAIACFLRVLEHKKGDANIYENIAMSYAELGRHGEALPYYARAIELDPSHNSAHHNKGRSHAATGDYAGALSCYLRAIELCPDNAQSHHSLGLVYMHLDDYASSLPCFARAIELDGSYGDAYYNKGLAHTELGEYAEALACYERSLEYRPNADACHGIGLVYMELGEYGKALSSYERGLTLPGDHRGINRNIGVVYCVLGDKPKGYEYFIQSARTGNVEVQQLLEEEGIDWKPKSEVHKY